MSAERAPQGTNAMNGEKSPTRDAHAGAKLLQSSMINTVTLIQNGDDGSGIDIKSLTTTAPSFNLPSAEVVEVYMTAFANTRCHGQRPLQPSAYQSLKVLM